MTIGIITNAMVASIKSKLADYKETAEAYIFGQLAEGIEAADINIGRTVWDEETGEYYLPSTERGIKEIIENIEEFYENRMLIMEGKLCYGYRADLGETSNDDIPRYAKDMGINVIQYGNFKYDGEKSVYSALTSYVYDENGAVIGTSEYYMCTPDLSGFNSDKTYYISFRDITNISTVVILDKICDAYTYTNAWYDYPSKSWANVLTLNDETMTYWVWVPRYAYNSKQLDENDLSYIPDSMHFDGISSNYDDLDVKFVNTSNQYWDSASGGFKELSSDYVVPEAFTFDGLELGGFWMSKYEVEQKTGNNGDFYITASVDAIGIVTRDQANAESYTVYVDAETDASYSGVLNSVVPITKTTKLSNLEPDTEYLISIYDSYGIRKWTQSIHTLTYQPENEIYSNITVDISGFATDTTYFVLYNEEGASPVLVPFSETATTKSSIEAYLTGLNIDYNDQDNDGDGLYWYNYGDKRSGGVAKIWANIATVSNNKISYWTYIPRYCYYQLGGLDSTSFDMRFIPSAVTKDNISKQKGVDEENDDEESVGQENAVMYVSVDISSNYVIPDAFNFDGNDIAGYWMSKYEVECCEKLASYVISVDTNRVSIYSSLYSQYGELNNPGTFYTVDVLKNGTKVTEKCVTTPTKNQITNITGLAYDADYTINIYANLNTVSGYVPILQMSKVIHTGVDLRDNANTYDYANISVDVSGFDKSNTKFVLYSVTTSNGNQVVTEASSSYSLETLRTSGTWTGGSWGAKNTATEYVFTAEAGVAKVTYNSTTYTWFDYSNKIWANIKTTNSAEKWIKGASNGSAVSTGTSAATGTYFTYVPRYAYSLDETTGLTNVKFVDTSNRFKNSSGSLENINTNIWTVPDAFRFDKVDLYGYWMSKYEVGVPTS